jgi:hypothetical protein
MSRERWRCEPARFVNGRPEPRPGLTIYFDAPGLARFAADFGGDPVGPGAERGQYAILHVADVRILPLRLVEL